MKRSGLLFLLLLILVATAPFASARPTIVLDAGHGGHDRGGVPGQKYSEKIYTLDVTHRVNARLRSAGFRTVLTRDGDYFVGLRERCAVSNRISNSVFLSIHFNSAPREGANGIETYYYSRKSASFAAAVHSRVVRAAGTENRRVRQRGFFVIRKNSRIAVLAELGFLTNRQEGGRIANSAAYRQSLADALANAVISKF